MIISTNTKMSIKISASNNRIIIKESFAQNSITDLFGINEKVSRHPPPLIT